MESVPPDIQERMRGIRDELIASANGHIDLLLVNAAVAAALRLELHFREKAALNCNDHAWDLAQDRLLRRFLRCADAVRFPRRRPAPPTHRMPALAKALAACAASPAIPDQAAAPRPRNKPAPFRYAPSTNTPNPDPAPPVQAAEATDDAPEPDLEPAPQPQQPRRRPDPEKLLRRSRQQRRRLARQRQQDARASPSA